MSDSPSIAFHAGADYLVMRAAAAAAHLGAAAGK